MTGPARVGNSELERDYAVLRGDVGAVSLDHDVISVTGAEAATYLQGQLSQDVEALEVGRSAPSLLLSPQGKVDALLRVARISAGSYLLDVEGGFGQAVVDRLSRFRLRTRVEFQIEAWRCVSLRGPAIPRVLGTVGQWDGDTNVTGMAIPADWPGSPGVDLVGPEPLALEGVEACGIEAWETVRVEAGVPRLGIDVDGATIAAEAGLVDAAVSMTKGCYVGQELVARIDSRGSRVARRLLGLVLAADDPFPPRGAELRRDQDPKRRGVVTSVAWSPSRRRVVALAYVHRDLDPGCEVELSWEGGTTRATVEGLPLVS